MRSFPISFENEVSDAVPVTILGGGYSLQSVCPGCVNAKGQWHNRSATDEEIINAGKSVARFITKLPVSP